ncbi:unnamed protein product [Lathyrus oleraceus]
MTKTLKFLSAIILFFSLILLSKETEEIRIKCVTDADCPAIRHLYPLVYKCIKNLCEAIKVDPSLEE